MHRFLGQGNAPVRPDEEMTPWPLARRAAILIGTWAVLAGPFAAYAQTGVDHGEIRGLKLGLNARSMRLAGFGELACGSNGGAPRRPLDGWSAFAKCRPEDSGLHEVYARFDD